MASMDDIKIQETNTGGQKVSMLRSPAAERNKDPILRVIREEIGDNPGPMFALEIASGTGQHIMYFADNLPSVTWQPSECDQKSIDSIKSYVKVHQSQSKQNILPPLWIDTTQPIEKWGEGKLTPGCCDIILCINMVHISEWASTQGLFKGCQVYLKPGGLLAIYGPFKVQGSISPESNVQFDQMLRQQCGEWGLRDIEELKTLAAECDMALEKMLDMPANNKTLVLRKN